MRFKPIFLLYVKYASATIVECSANAAKNKGCYLQDSFPGGGQWITVACADNYVLTFSGDCVAPCPAGKYLFGSECVDCAQNCDSCFGPNDFQCSQCSANFALNFQHVCSLQCARSDQYGTPDLLECSTCHPSCASCYDDGETACTACPASNSESSYSLRIFTYATGKTNAGYCLEDPSLEYPSYYRQYPDDRVVIQCPTGCVECSDRFTCIQCQNGYFLHPPASSGAQYALCYPV